MPLCRDQVAPQVQGAFSAAYDKILMDTGWRWPHKLLSARAVRFLKPQPVSRHLCQSRTMLTCARAEGGSRRVT